LKIKILICALLAVGGFYAGYKAADIKITTDVGISKEIVEKNGEKRTIYRVQRKKTKETTVKKKRYRFSVLAEPSRPQNYEIGAGYRVLDDIFLEGAWRPSEGKVMVGVSVLF